MSRLKPAPTAIATGIWSRISSISKSPDGIVFNANRAGAVPAGMTGRPINLVSACGTRPYPQRLPPGARHLNLCCFRLVREHGGARKQRQETKMKTILIPAVAGLAMIAGISIAAADEVI